MLSSFLSKSPTLSITVEEETFTVRPRIDSASAPPSSVDTIVRGTVSLELSTPKAVRNIKVMLVGLCDVMGSSSLWPTYSHVQWVHCPGLHN